MDDGKLRKTAIEEIRNTVGDGKVLLALSGGVDSSVAAALISKAVGDQLTCIFVDHGLMRKNEGDEVEAAFKDSGMHFIRVDAEKRFLDKLAGLEDPEAKRKAIGEEFIRVFEDEAVKLVPLTSWRKVQSTLTLLSPVLVKQKLSNLITT